MNNYRLKHLKLDAIGNQEILHDGLLPIITEIETKKAFFSEIMLLFVQLPLERCGLRFRKFHYYHGWHRD